MTPLERGHDDKEISKLTVAQRAEGLFVLQKAQREESRALAESLAPLLAEALEVNVSTLLPYMEVRAAQNEESGYVDKKTFERTLKDGKTEISEFLLVVTIPKTNLPANLTTEGMRNLVASKILLRIQVRGNDVAFTINPDALPNENTVQEKSPGIGEILKEIPMELRRIISKLFQ